MGTVKPVEATAREAARDEYLKTHPAAAQWATFGDFQFYRLVILDVYFVAGFGAMGWVPPAEFAAAHG